MVIWLKRQYRRFILVPWWKLRLEARLKQESVRYELALETRTNKLAPKLEKAIAAHDEFLTNAASKWTALKKKTRRPKKK